MWGTPFIIESSGDDNGSDDDDYDGDDEDDDDLCYSDAKVMYKPY